MFRKSGKQQLYQRALEIARTLPDQEFGAGGGAYWRIVGRVEESAPDNLSFEDIQQAVGKAVRIRRGELRRMKR
ncbi:MAG TPA: hypothetical protein ENJ31_01540 [Anaerolineae bacterium]|nr:hypothetical protein [Anaerolineae bacterium]